MCFWSTCRFVKMSVQSCIEPINLRGVRKIILCKSSTFVCYTVLYKTNVKLKKKNKIKKNTCFWCTTCIIKTSFATTGLANRISWKLTNGKYVKGPGNHRGLFSSTPLSQIKWLSPKWLNRPMETYCKALLESPSPSITNNVFEHSKMFLKTFCKMFLNVLWTLFVTRRRAL